MRPQLPGEGDQSRRRLRVGGAGLWIVCGHCVEVCPNGAKKVRDDLANARQLLTLKKSAFVSLAPSFVTEFPGVKPAQMIGALKKLGFAGVSETALGAQQVSAQAAACGLERHLHAVRDSVGKSGRRSNGHPRRHGNPCRKRDKQPQDEY